MRYERKYKVSYLNYHVVLQAIGLHPVGIYRLYADRQINNIYFDTVGLTNFYQNVDGVAHRKKYRIRWYGDDISSIQNPNFEIKIRKNELGSKVVIPIPKFELYDLKSITQNINHLNIMATTVPLQPVLMNSYLRSYYATKDRKYRLTIDRNLRYFSLLNANRFTRYNLKDNAVILEIKYDETHDQGTDRITQFFPFRQTKSSKYVTGVFLTNR